MRIYLVIIMAVVVWGCGGARVVSEMRSDTTLMTADTTMVQIPLHGEVVSVYMPVVVNPLTGSIEGSSIQKQTPRANVTLSVDKGVVTALVEVKDTTLLVPEIIRTYTRTITTETVKEAREPLMKRFAQTLLTGLGIILLLAVLIMFLKAINQ